MVEQDRADRAVIAQIIFDRRVIAVPCDDVQRAVADLGLMELATPFYRQSAGHLTVFEGGDRGLEIPPVGHAVGPDRATAGQLELLPVIFAHEPAGGALDHFDAVDQTTGQQGDLLWFQVDDAQLRTEAKAALLRHDQQFGIGGIEIFVLHALGHEVDMRGHADLRVHVTGGGHRVHSGQPGHRLLRMGKRIPAILAKAGHIVDDMRRGFPVRRLKPRVAARMFDRGANPVAPCAFILMAGRGEGGARQLFAIQAVIASLGAVHPLRQCAGQGLRLKVVAEPRHVAFGRSHRCPRDVHRR